MSWELEGRPLRRVLVTRLRYLGDVVMSTVVLEVLRAGDPDLEIDYLCEDTHAEVLAGYPHLRRVHGLGSNRRGSDARARAAGREASDRSRGTLGTIRALRSGEYDLAVDLFFNPRSAWLLWLGGIPLRIGGARGSRGRLYTHRATPDDPFHAGAEFVARAPGGLGHHLSRLAPLRHRESGRDFDAWFLDRFGPGELAPRLPRRGLDEDGRRALKAADCEPDAPFVLVAPGATWATKEWPREHWASFLAEASPAGEPRVAVLVPPGRANDFAPLAATLPPGRGGVLPAMPLSSVLGLVGAAAAVVSVDGGIMHAAVAQGVPTVALFGPTSPEIWFPYDGVPRCRVLATRPHCHPCDLHQCDAFVCLPDLSPATVMSSLAEVLEETP